MQRVLIFLVLIFLTGCAPPPEKDIPQLNTTPPPEDAPLNTSSPSQLLSDDYLEKYYASRGLDVLDFRTLTADTCVSELTHLKEDRGTLLERISDARDDLEKEKADLEQARQNYEDSLSSGNEDYIGRLDEELNEQEDDYDEVERRLKEYVKQEEKYDHVIDDVNDYCLYLHATQKS